MGEGRKKIKKPVPLEEDWFLRDYIENDITHIDPKTITSAVKIA